MWGQVTRIDEPANPAKAPNHGRLFKKLSKRIMELHSYDVPEILAVPIVDGSQAYLDWMKAALEPVKE